jgi:hypothetical protein
MKTQKSNIMLFKKGEKYLLTYNVGNYTEIGTYIGIIHYDDNGIEHMFKANGRTVLVLEEENKEIKPNLMEELTEGIEALKERRNMERDKLDERLGERDRVDQEIAFAPHMEEKQYININDLVKDFARIINGQRKEIDTLTEERNMTRDQLLKDYARIIDEQREEILKLKERIAILSKRHPTTEEAIAQYHWLKENSKRNKNVE